MYNIDNTNNIGNMGHLTKEQFTWQFWNMAGITMYLQLPFNSSSHLFYLHDLWESQTYMASCVDWGFRGGGGIGFYTWCLVSDFERNHKRPRQDFSLQYQYNIEQASYENKKKTLIRGLLVDTIPNYPNHKNLMADSKK